MTLNYADIVACPFCGKPKELLSIVPDNTFKPILWSDGKQIPPLRPEVSPVQKCPRCRKYYLYYKQPTKTADHESFTTGILSYKEWKEAFAQLNVDPTLDAHDISVIYMRLIQAFNDHYYRGPAPAIYTKETTPPQEEYAFIVQVIDTFISSSQWETPSAKLLKAELFREAGHFSQCIQTQSIDSICLDDFERSIYSSILFRATTHDHKVFKCPSQISVSPLIRDCIRHPSVRPL